jgi:hypothetical protein
MGVFLLVPRPEIFTLRAFLLSAGAGAPNADPATANKAGAWQRGAALATPVRGPQWTPPAYQVAP